MAKCSKCQHENEESEEFCSSCGFHLRSDELHSSESHQETQVHKLSDLAYENMAHDDDLLKGSGPRLVVMQGAKTGSKFTLGESTVTLGRHPTSDIFLDDVTVSRRHAEIHKVGDTYELQDMGSLNGTYINKERIEVKELDVGDEVQVGKFKFLFLL